jgi:outer membrane protein
MVKYLSHIVLGFAISTTANAQNTQPLSLQQCIDYAIVHHPSIKNLKFEEELQDLKNKEITGLTRPQVSATAGITAMVIVPKSRSDASAFGGAFGSLPFLIDSPKAAELAKLPPARYSTLKFGLPFNASTTVTATQILYDPSIVVALEARQGIMDLMRINTQIGTEGIRYNVAKAYYNTLTAERRTKSLEDNIKLVNDFYILTDKLYKEGFAEKIDAERLLVQKNNLDVEKNKIQNLIQISYQLLKFQMGMPLDQQVLLTDTINIQEIDQAALTEEVDFRNRTEMQQLSLATKMQQLDLIRHEKSYLPSVIAFGNAGLASSTKSIGDLFTYGYFPSSMVGVNASIPIYDGHQRKMRVQQAKVKLAQLENTKTTAQNGIALETANAKTQLRNNIISYQNQTKNIALAQKILNTVQKKYKEGLGSAIEVIQAQTALKDAQTNYDAALFELTSSYIDLQKALGKLK